jgi:hypothetical protein
MAELDIEGIQNALDELQEKFGISDTALASFTKAVKKTSSDFNKSITDLNKEIAKNKAGYKAQIDLISKLDDAIEDLTESAKKEQNATKKLATEQEKAALLAQRDALQTSASMRGMQEATAKAATGMTTAAIKGAGALVKGLQSNASSTELSAGLMNAGIDVATTGIKGLGQGAQAVAPMLMRFGPWGMAAGVALEFLGIAASASADTMNKLAKFGVEVLQKEVEKTVKAYNTMNASGAMFANGMQGMRNASLDAGLTVEQFSGVVKDNGAAIAAAGYGMTEGSKKIGGALKAGGDTMKRQLLNLGFGFEEQAALVAETMKDMRAAGGPLRASDAVVAEQTQKYAENLRIIASITGEDAKKKMEETRNQANQLMFQQKLAGMDEKQRQNVINAMGNMSKQQQQDYMDMVNFGTVINRTGAVMSATMPSYAASIQASADATKRGVLDDKVQRDINARYQKGINKEVLDQQGIAAANAAKAAGVANDAAGGFLDVLKFNQTQTKEAIAAAEKDKDAAKDTTDPLTKSLINAEKASQALKISMQKMMEVPIEKYAKTAEAMLTGLQNMIDEAFGGKPKPGFDENNKVIQKPVTFPDANKPGVPTYPKKGDKPYFPDADKADLLNPNRKPTFPHADKAPKSPVKMYAEGGTIPAGQTGIVGEAGPEFVKGPAEVTSAKESKEILSKLGNISVGQLTSQAMDKMSYLTSESDGSIAGYFLAAAKALKNDNGVWTIGGEVIDQNTAREILDFVQGWPKLKQEIQGEIDKAKEMIGEGGGKLDAALTSMGTSTKVSDLATGFAKGGIASGSLSGYSATLHGTEAVVPLPDNKSIPVSLDSSALSGALQAQSDILSNILSAMQQNNKYASGLLQNSY